MGSSYSTCLTGILEQTWSQFRSKGVGNVCLPFGHYANVIDIGQNMGLAITTDGVGSKTLVAKRLGRYYNLGIDCVAMNVNDLLCVGATPLSMVDALSVGEEHQSVFEEIAKGLVEGAEQAHIAIVGGEVAGMQDVVHGLDLVGTAIGLVPLDKMIIGQDIQPGDVVIGIESHGFHCNGFTQIRRALEHNDELYETPQPQLLASWLGCALLWPTHIYVEEVQTVLEEGLHVKGMAHITGDGLLNLRRLTSQYTFVLDDIPSPSPIFKIIQEIGGFNDAEMFSTFNMGIGFCLVVPREQRNAVLACLEQSDKLAYQIGVVAQRFTADCDVAVQTNETRLYGRGTRFEEIDLKK